MKFGVWCKTRSKFDKKIDEIQKIYAKLEQNSIKIDEIHNFMKN